MEQFSWLRSWFRGAASQHASRKRRTAITLKGRSRHRLAWEPLEERQLLAVDLVLTMSDGRTAISPRDTASVVLTYQNVGSDEAAGVWITFDPEHGFDPNASTPGWVLSSAQRNEYQFWIGSLPSGAGGSVTFASPVASVAPAGREEIVNSATIRGSFFNGPDTTPANNTAIDVNILDAAPALSLTLTDRQETTVAGSTLRYTLRYGNQGNQAASGVVLTQYLPAGTTFNPARSSSGWIETSPGVFQNAVGTVRPGSVPIRPFFDLEPLFFEKTFAVTVNDPSATGQTKIIATATIADDGLGGPELSLDNNTAIDTTRFGEARVYAIAADAGGGPHVRFYDAAGEERFQVFAYSPNFTGGVRVATADVTGDGIPDLITAAGPGGGPHIRVFDGVTGQQAAGAIGSFFAYNIAFTGGVFVAAADFNGDGLADIVTGADSGGGPHVRVFSGADGTVMRDFFASNYNGVRVATGDINRDGAADIITAPGPGSLAPEVRTYDGKTGHLLSGGASKIVAYPGFDGGAYVATGDLNGDGYDDIVTGAGAGGGPHVKAFSGLDGSVLANFFPFNNSYRGGVRVGAIDLNSDGRSEILTSAGPGSQPLTLSNYLVNGVWTSGYSSITTFTFPANFRGGSFVTGSAPRHASSAAALLSPGAAAHSSALRLQAANERPSSQIKTSELPEAADVELPVKAASAGLVYSTDALFRDEHLGDDWKPSNEVGLAIGDFAVSRAVEDRFWEDVGDSLTMN